MHLPTSVDVLVVGAGPVGLLTALGLEQQGVSSLLVEKRPRKEQVMHGRATTLYPRSLELLEQVDVTRRLMQEGFVGRSSVCYLDGKRANDRGWNIIMSHFKSSFHDYCLNIRQRRSEDAIRKLYEAHGKSVGYGWKLSSFSIETGIGDGFNVSATLENDVGEIHRVRSKYLVGADGGSSTVRRLANIAEDVDPTLYQWVRIDGKMSTDMPGADVGFGAVETRTHGSVLWVKLDRDAHRIGYVLTPSVLAKYPKGLTQEDALAEAAVAMKPFKFEVDRLDWWTHYKIKQSVVHQIQKEDFILLGGDAAHTHSSGFAQGMNTGIHDATNLVWKLAGACKGWYKPCVLESYNQERLAAAQQLIAIDKYAASVISGDVPPAYAASGKTAHELLQVVLWENVGFVDGLGIRYKESALNREPTDTVVQCGGRAPDVLLYEPGPELPVRLYSGLLQDGRRGIWSIIIFTGEPKTTSERYRAACERLSGFVDRRSEMLRVLTIIAGTAGSGWAAMNGPVLGDFLLDATGKAHAEYGVDRTRGAIAIVRPDHILATAGGLDETDAVVDYFARVAA